MDGLCKQRRSIKDNGNKQGTHTENQKEITDILGTNNEERLHGEYETLRTY